MIVGNKIQLFAVSDLAGIRYSSSLMTSASEYFCGASE